MKKCPFCAEEINEDAIKCKHCGEFLNAKDSQEKKQNAETVGSEIPPDILSNCTQWKIHKVKNPKQYGGWSKFMVLWCLIPIIGLIISISGKGSTNAVKKAQAESLLISSLIMGVLGFISAL